MTMFLADENVWLSLVEELRARGHSVRAVREFASGALDEEVLELAYAAGEILVTEDSDFGPLVFKEGRACVGIVLFLSPGSGAPVRALPKRSPTGWKRSCTASRGLSQ